MSLLWLLEKQVESDAVVTSGVERMEWCGAEAAKKFLRDEGSERVSLPLFLLVPHTHTPLGLRIDVRGGGVNRELKGHRGTTTTISVGCILTSSQPRPI